jgi:hypothetical protein
MHTLEIAQSAEHVWPGVPVTLKEEGLSLGITVNFWADDVHLGATRKEGTNDEHANHL